jgi:hypothetical protein
LKRRVEVEAAKLVLRSFVILGPSVKKCPAFAATAAQLLIEDRKTMFSDDLSKDVPLNWPQNLAECGQRKKLCQKCRTNARLHPARLRFRPEPAPENDPYQDDQRPLAPGP